MKVLGGAEGKGLRQTAKLSAPEYYETAVRYALGIPGLSVAIMGMRRLSDLQTALKTVRGYRPFNAGELTAIQGRGRQMARVSGDRCAVRCRNHPRTPSRPPSEVHY